jgi:hypothetical protein
MDTGDPVIAVRKAVGAIFADLRPVLPINLEVLLERRRIALLFGDVPSRKEALLKPVRGGFHLIIPKQAPSQQLLFSEPARRFTIAHELIESFFFSSESEVPVHWSLLSGYRALATPHALSSSGSEERLCDYGAGLILVPTQRIREMTDDGERIPNESSLLSVARQCSTGRLSLCHRIANFLRVKHSRHAVVALIRKCPNPNSDQREVAWRLAPTRKGGGHPVGVDIEAALKHRFFLPTNRALGDLGFGCLERWLEEGGGGNAPVGEESQIRQNGHMSRLVVRAASVDERRGAAVVWFDLDFGL